MIGYNPRPTRRAFLQLGIKALYFTEVVGPMLTLAACLGDKEVSYKSGDVEKEKAELEETIEREVGTKIESKPPATVQKTKNIWTANPDYVGRGVGDFIIPDELKGDPFIIMTCPRGRSYEVSVCVEVQGRIPENYVVRRAEYGEINELGLTEYNEFYDDGKIKKIIYRGNNFFVELYDHSGNGIIDLVGIKNKDGIFVDRDGNGKLEMIQSFQKFSTEEATKQIENKIGSEIVGSIK